MDLLQAILLPLRQAWLSHRTGVPQVCLKVSHSELKTIFFTRNVRDGYFPRAAHKSLLFRNVSKRVCLHVLREEWGSINRTPLPPSLETVLFSCCRGATWALLRRKGNTFLSEGSISLESSRVRALVEWTSTKSRCITFLKRQLNTSRMKCVLNFFFFYYCELHYGYFTPLLDLETRGMMIIHRRNRCP